MFFFDMSTLVHSWSYLDEADLGRIALSCHFALDVLCDKAEMHALFGTIAC